MCSIKRPREKKKKNGSGETWTVASTITTLSLAPSGDADGGLKQSSAAAANKIKASATRVFTHKRALSKMLTLDRQKRFSVSNRAIDHGRSACIIDRDRHSDVEHIACDQAGGADIESFLGEGK